jgi:hypothetical protein
MFTPKRLAMLAVTAALALVPASATASVPSHPEPVPLKPCVLKWIKAPSTTASYPTPPGPDSFDVENGYADSGADDDGTVEHDDLTYDGC